MKTVGNIIWLLTAGWMLSLLWFLTGIGFCISIIGIPFGLQFFKIAIFSLWPFGKVVVFGDGGLAFLMNLIWIMSVGWVLCLTGLIWSLVFFVSIIGIPFGIQAFKLAKLGFLPFGAIIKK